MPFLLTRAAILTCAHEGLVQVPQLPGPVSIDGAAVLCMGDLVGLPILNCTQLAPGTKPCMTVGPPVPGSWSETVMIEGRAAHLDTFTAPTDGFPPGTVHVDFAGQEKIQG